MLRHTLLVAMLAAASAAQADPVLYDFQDIFGGITNPATTPLHLQASKVTFGHFGGGGCENTDFGVTNDFACGGVGDGTVSFTVAAEAGWLFDVNGFSFQGLGTGDYAPTSFAVFSSLDGFAVAVLTGDLTNQVRLQRYNYGAGFTAHDLEGPLELRIVSTGSPTLGVNSAWLVDNLRLDVTVKPANAVPEPGSLPLVALALMAALGAGPTGQRSLRR